MDFLAKYWLQFLFGLIISGGGLWIKHYQKLLKNAQETKEHKFWEEIKAQISKDHDTLETQMNEQDSKIKAQIEALCGAVQQTNQQIEVIKDGMLSIQGKTFKQDCRKLLAEDHKISLEEYENLTIDHDVYNKLGGNHEGDSLYDLVTTKYAKEL